MFTFPLTVTSSFTGLNIVTLSTPKPHLKTWDKAGSLKRLSFGRTWPRTAAWTNFVRTSDGLWWVPTFSSKMPSLRMSWIHRCLSSMCFDFLDMPKRDAVAFRAEESVSTVILTSLERIADLNSWMKCLIASDSTVAWVIAYSSALADEWDTEAWVLVDALLTENNVMSDLLVDLRDFDILPNLNLNSWQSQLEWDLENLGLELRLHNEDEVSCLVDILEEMLEVVEVWFLGIWQRSWQPLEGIWCHLWAATSATVCLLLSWRVNDSLCLVGILTPFVVTLDVIEDATHWLVAMIHHSWMIWRWKPWLIWLRLPRMNL